ncbi:DUF6397 family protein [Streptomyces sp. NBC_00728]|uniref:DUF6397 family protein n=1 Tax=Streptomyces sp. NBC_00728 TaxID=2903676 RepID=UPI00386FFE2E
MSGNTVTQPATSSLSRAARELELRRGEFDLALHLGCVRSVPDEGGGGRRVARAEIDRVRSEAGFPETLRERVRAVGTTEGAALMGVTAQRFTRLARLGLVVPVKFYMNRYRVVVWLYLAEELRQFATDQQNARMMSGRTPEGLRDQLDDGLDLRPRNWRGRHLGFLLRLTEDPWARAAAVASLLDPVHVAAVVDDPYERAHLNRLRPGPVSQAAPDSPAARIAERIATADEPDEIGWLRADLSQSVSEAREDGPAPRPAPDASSIAVPRPTAIRPTARPEGAPPSAAPLVPPRTPGTLRERLAATDAPLTATDDPLTTTESARSRRLLRWLRRVKPDARPPTRP